MKTNFQKVKEFHETFELDINTTPQFNVFTKNPKLVKLRMDDLSKSEYDIVLEQDNYAKYKKVKKIYKKRWGSILHQSYFIWCSSVCFCTR